MPSIHQTKPKAAVPPTSLGKRGTGGTPSPEPVAYAEDDGWGRISGMSVLLYGESGTGKTSLWATFPAPIRVLLCSGGNKPGELKSVDTPENRRRILPKVINTSGELYDAIEEAKDGKYRTVVLDHASGFASLLMKEYLGLTDLPAVKKWGMATQKDWGSINDKCIETLRLFLNLPGNIVVVAQEAIFKAKEEGIPSGLSDIIKPQVGPAMTPGVVKWLYPTMDYIVQTCKRPKMREFEVQTMEGQPPTIMREKVGGTEYVLRCDCPEVVMTKFRKLKEVPIPEFIVDPTYEKIQTVIQGKYQG